MSMFAPLVLALAVAAPLPKSPAKEAPSVVGEWVVESSVTGDGVKPFAAGTRLTFTADGRLLIEAGPRTTAQRWRYTTDPKRSPAELDAAPGDAAVADATHRMVGVYKVDGDFLTIAGSWDNARPTAFDAPAGSLGHVLTLKRVKKD
jgi:uncharacterized protein (TIGR03067 family)